MSDGGSPSPFSAGVVRWGILAAGGIARVFTADLLAHGHRVQAVGSRSAHTAEAFAAELDLPRAHSSYDALVADADVDVVYVASPHPFHAAHARLALDHGKHVLVEKPFTLTAEQAQQVADLGRRNGLLVMEAMWTRFLPHMEFVRSVVGSGRIGQVRWVHADHTQRLPAAPEHRLNDLRLGGGALLDLGIYPLSFACDLLGTPVEVDARAAFKPSGVDASVTTMLQHPGGTVSTSHSSMETVGPNTATVLGTAGSIDIASIWYAPTTVTVRDAEGAVVDGFDDPVAGRGMQYQAAEVERLLGAGQTASPLLTPAESVRIMAAADEIRARIGLRYPDL